jgi:hypothetical protein
VLFESFFIFGVTVGDVIIHFMMMRLAWNEELSVSINGILRHLIQFFNFTHLLRRIK